MEIRVSRSEFLAELVPMQGIVERRTTIPVLSHILLKGGDPSSFEAQLPVPFQDKWQKILNALGSSPER